MIDIMDRKLSNDDLSPDNFLLSQDACAELFTHKPEQQQLPPYDNESQVLSEVLQAAMARDVPKVVRLAASLGISNSGSSSLVVSSTGDLLPDSTTTSKDSACGGTPVDLNTEGGDDDDALKPSKSSTSSSPEVTQSNIIADINQVDLDASSVDNQSLPVEAGYVMAGQSNLVGKPGSAIPEISGRSVLTNQLSPEYQSASISSTCQDKSIITKTTTTTAEQRLLPMVMPGCATSQSSAIGPSTTDQPTDRAFLDSTGLHFPANTNQQLLVLPPELSDQPPGRTDVVAPTPASTDLLTTGPPPLAPPVLLQSQPTPSLPAVISLSLTPVSPNGDFLPVRVSLPGLPDVIMQVLPQPGARVGDSYTIDVPSHLILSGISSALASGTAVNGTPIMLYISPSSSATTTTTTAPPSTATPPPTGNSQQISNSISNNSVSNFLPGQQTTIAYNTTSLPVTSQLRQTSIISANNNNKKMRAIAPKPSLSVSLSVSSRTSSSTGLGKSSHKRQTASAATVTTAGAPVTFSTGGTAVVTVSSLATPAVPSVTAAAVYPTSPFLVNNSGGSRQLQQQQSTSLSPIRTGRGRRKTVTTTSSNNNNVISNGLISTFPCGIPNVLLSANQQHTGSLPTVGAVPLSDVNTAGGLLQQHQPHLLAPVTGHGGMASMQTTIMPTRPGIFAPHDMNCHPVVTGNSVFQPGAMPFLFGGAGGVTTGAPLLGASNGPSPAYMFQPPFPMQGGGVGTAVCGSISTPPVYTPPSSCHLLPSPSNTQSNCVSNPLSVAMMPRGLSASATESPLFPTASTPLCPSSGMLSTTPYVNQSASCLPGGVPMNNGHQYAQQQPPPPPADSSVPSPFGISLVCSQAGQGAVGLLLPHDGTDGSCLSQPNSLVYSLSGQPMLAPQPPPVLTAVSSAAHYFSSSASNCQAFSTSVSSMHPPLPPSLNGILTNSLPPALISTSNMLYSTGPSLTSQQPIFTLQQTDSTLSTFEEASCGGEERNQIGDDMDQDDLLTLAWRLTQEDFDTTTTTSTGHHQPLVLVEATNPGPHPASDLGIYSVTANNVSLTSHVHSLPTEFVDCDLYAEQQDVVEAESDEVVLLDCSTTPAPAVVGCQPTTEEEQQPVGVGENTAPESTGNADIDALLAAAAQIGAASGVGDAQSSVAVALPVPSAFSVSPTVRSDSPQPSVLASLSTKPIDTVVSTFDPVCQEDQGKSPTSLEQAADDLFGTDDVTRHDGEEEVSFDGTDEPTSLAAVLGCNAEDAADLESVLGPEGNEVGNSGPVSHSFLNSLVGDEAGVVKPHIFDEDFTVCGDGHALEKCFETPSADIENDHLVVDCRSRESDVPIHDENSYSSTSCSVHEASSMPFPTPSSKQVRSLLRNTLPAPMSFHFDELSGRRPATSRGGAEGHVSDPNEDVDAVFLDVDFTDDVGEYTTAEQFQEALMLLGPQPNSPAFDLGDGCTKDPEVNIFPSVSAISADLATAFNGDQNLDPCIVGGDDDDGAAGEFDAIPSPDNRDNDDDDDDIIPLGSERSSNTVPSASPLTDVPASYPSESLELCKDANVSGEEEKSLTSPVISPSETVITITTRVENSNQCETTDDPASEAVEFTGSILKISSLINDFAASPHPVWSLSTNTKTTSLFRSSSLPRLCLLPVPSASLRSESRRRCSSAPPSLSVALKQRFYRDASPTPSPENDYQIDQDTVPVRSEPSPESVDLLLPNTRHLSPEVTQLVSPDDADDHGSTILDENLPAATSSIISVLASSSALVEAAVKYTDSTALDSDISPVKSNLESLDKLDRMLESCQRRSQQNHHLNQLTSSDSSKPSSSLLDLMASDSDSKNITTSQEESLTSSSLGDSVVESGGSGKSTGAKKSRTKSKEVANRRSSLEPTRKRSRQFANRHSSDSTCTTEESTDPSASSDAPSQQPTTASSSSAAVTTSPSDMDSLSTHGIVDNALVTFGIGCKRPLSFGLSMDPVDTSIAPSLVPIAGNFTQHLPQLTLSVDGSLFPGAVDPSLCDINSGEVISRPESPSAETQEGTATIPASPSNQLAVTYDDRVAHARCRSARRRAKRVAKGSRRRARGALGPPSANQDTIVSPEQVSQSQPFARFADSNCSLPSFASVQTAATVSTPTTGKSHVLAGGASWLSASSKEAVLFGNYLTQEKTYSVVESPSDSVNGFTTAVSSATFPTPAGFQSSPSDTDVSVAISVETRKSSPPKLAAEQTGFESAAAVGVVGSGSVGTPSSNCGSVTNNPTMRNTSFRQPLSLGSAFAKEDSPFVKFPLTASILSTSTTVAGVTFGSFAGAAAFRATSFSALAAKATASTSCPQDLKSLTFSDLAKKTTNASSVGGGGLHQVTGKSWSTPPSSSSVSSQHGATSTPLPVMTFSPASGVTPRQGSESDSSALLLQPTPLFQNTNRVAQSSSSTKLLDTSLYANECLEKTSPTSTLLPCSPVVVLPPMDCPADADPLNNQPTPAPDEAELSGTPSPLLPPGDPQEPGAPKLLIRLRGCNPSDKSRNRRGRRKGRFPYVSRVKVGLTSAQTDTVPDDSLPPAKCLAASTEDHYHCCSKSGGTPDDQQQVTATKDTEVQLHHSPVELTPTDARSLSETNAAVLNSSSSASEHLPNDTPVSGNVEPIGSVKEDSSSSPLLGYSDKPSTDFVEVRPSGEAGQRDVDQSERLLSDEVNGLVGSSRLLEPLHEKDQCILVHYTEGAEEPREPLRLRLNLKLAGLRRRESKSKKTALRARATEDGSGSVSGKKRRKKHKQMVEQLDNTAQLQSAIITTASESDVAEPYPIAADTCVHSEQTNLNQKQVVDTPFQLGRSCNSGRGRTSRMYKIGINRPRVVAGPNDSTNLLHAIGPAGANNNKDLLAGRSSSVTSRKIFSTAKQERRSSCALLVARPWRPVSVVSPRKRGMISSPPVPTKSSKLVMMTVKKATSTESPTTRKHKSKRLPTSKASRRTDKVGISCKVTAHERNTCMTTPNDSLSTGNQTPIRLVIRLGQSQPLQTISPGGKRSAETLSNRADELLVEQRNGNSNADTSSLVSPASGTATPPDDVEVEELFQFCIATEAETYVDVNQAQIKRIANPAILAQIAASGYPTPLSDGVTCPRINSATDVDSVSRHDKNSSSSLFRSCFADTTGGEAGQTMVPLQQHHQRRQKSRRRSRRLDDDPNSCDVLVDVVSVGSELSSSTTEAEHLRSAAYESERMSTIPNQMAQHNGYFRYPLPTDLPWTSSTGAKGHPVSNNTSLHKGLFEGRQQHQPLDSRGCGAPAGSSALQERTGLAPGSEETKKDAYHHLAPHLLTESLTGQEQQQQHYRPAPDEESLSGSAVRSDNNDSNAGKTQNTSLSLATGTSHTASSQLQHHHHLEPLFPPETSWPEGSAHSAESQQQQALAMVCASASLRGRSLEQQDRMKAHCERWTRGDIAYPPDITVPPAFWDDLNFSYAYRPAGAAADHYSQQAQAQQLRASSNLFLDSASQPSASTTDYHRTALAQTSFPAVGVGGLAPTAYPHAGSSNGLDLRGAGGSPRAEAVGAAATGSRHSTDFGPLRVQREPRVSGW